MHPVHTTLLIQYQLVCVCVRRDEAIACVCLSVLTLYQP